MHKLLKFIFTCKHFRPLSIVKMNWVRQIKLDVWINRRNCTGIMFQFDLFDFSIEPCVDHRSDCPSLSDDCNTNPFATINLCPVLVLKRNLWSVSFFLQILLNNLKKFPGYSFKWKIIYSVWYIYNSKWYAFSWERQMSVVLVRIPLYEFSSAVTLAHYNTLWLILSNLTLYNTKLQGHPTSSLSESLTSSVLKKETKNWSF